MAREARRRRPAEGAKPLYHTSAAVLRTHESKRVEGGIIASLSIPWGFSKPDDDLGGYHLVWPRDLVETAGGFIAMGAHQEARRVLRYLQVTQEADGHWSQNMWLDGTPYWHGIQMDETALPILLVDLAARQGVLDTRGRDAFWPMVRRAAAFLARNGPVSPQDRWEEEPGYSPFTHRDRNRRAARRGRSGRRAGEHGGRGLSARDGRRLECQHRTMAVRLGNGVGAAARRRRVLRARRAARSRGCRVAVSRVRPDQEPASRIKRRGAAAQMVSLDALAFVRFGLRAADDPRIVSTVKVIDATLKVDTPRGPAWHRYQGDAYGEHADGEPFDGTGIGRAWPLLTGERAHYELAAGRTRRRRAAGAGDGEHWRATSGLLPEQIWDSADIPDRELFIGHASGSAMPLVWAHAEYLKLCRSLRDGEIFDRPPQTGSALPRRTGRRHPMSPGASTTRSAPCRRAESSAIETLAPAIVHWSVDDWRTVHDTATRDTTLGVHVADLRTRRMCAPAAA